MKTTTSYICTIIFLLISYIGYSQSKQIPSSLMMEDLKGKKVNLKEYIAKKDKVTVISFWATWCKPCKKAIPELNKIYEKYKENGLEIIGISCDGPRSASKVAPLSKSLQIKYPVLLDINSELRTDLNVSAFPTLIFVNKNGEIVKTHEGFLSGDEKEIEDEVKLLLNIK